MPVLFRSTLASGYVADQFGRPVPNARMLASWQPHDLRFLYAKRYTARFTADGDGRWEFRARNARDLCVEVLPSEGYQTISVSHSLFGPLRGGGAYVAQQPLRVRKILRKPLR